MENLHDGGFLISKIKQISERIFDKKLKSYNINDLNPAQGRIIYSLLKNDNITITELACKTALGKTTLTSMLDRLERGGFIERKNDGHDRRKVIVALSEKSKSLEELHAAVSQEMTVLFYDGLSETRIDEFEAVLRHILSNLETYEEKYK
ncbi:MAG: MarR family transcriptional regulator [Dehalococcoidales bacterium]|nr:MarR family transcriptional regulator [Dehalococcoidales bacterium]